MPRAVDAEPGDAIDQLLPLQRQRRHQQAVEDAKAVGMPMAGVMKARDRRAGDAPVGDGLARRGEHRAVGVRPKTYATVWEALADTPEQAANLRTRAELMQQIAAIIKESGWPQTEAADQCGVTQPRMSDLLRGRVSRFSLDALVNIATAIGRRVHFELEAA